MIRFKPSRGSSIAHRSQEIPNSSMRCVLKTSSILENPAMGVPVLCVLGITCVVLCSVESRVTHKSNYSSRPQHHHLSILGLKRWELWLRFSTFTGL